ncbi:MAG: DUF3096 domain-containing protein [Nanoarchaeota archaeon]|nr:DUF3096 domain-containing protein [Nanoarchaeota archaeon]
MATLKLTISGIITLIAGLLILFNPKLIRLVLGIYLVVVGILQMVDI